MYASLQDFEKQFLFLQIEPHIWLYKMKISKNLTLGSKKLDIAIFVLDFLGKMLFNYQFF